MRFCGWLCACVLALPSIPGEGGSCDVRSFNPETAAAAETTDPRVCRWWSPQASGGEGRDPEAEAHRSLRSGEWSLPSRRSRLGGSVGGLLNRAIGCRAARLSLPSCSVNLVCLLRSGSLEHFGATPFSQKQACPSAEADRRVGVPESKKSEG